MCNEVKPQCNQCKRDLSTRQCEVMEPKPRSKNGCNTANSVDASAQKEKPYCA